MGEIKSKRPVRRRAMRAENSPEPVGPMGGSSLGGTDSGSVCGHSGCGVNCSVQYAGPTSHIRDHHIWHAAQGVSHVWSAAIITGFAIVVTGAIAFNVAQAAQDKKLDTTAVTTGDLSQQVLRLSNQVESMNALLKRVAVQCSPAATTTQTGMIPNVNDKLGEDAGVVGRIKPHLGSSSSSPTGDMAPEIPR